MKNLSAYIVFTLLLLVNLKVHAADLYNAAGELETEKTKVIKEPEAMLVKEPVQEQEVNCEDVKQQMDTKITGYEAVKPEILTKFQNLLITLTGFSEKAKILGYDNVKLNTELGQLENLIDSYDSTSKTLVANLERSQTYVCSTNEDAYVTSIVTAKKSLAPVKTSITEIAKFYQNSIRNTIISMQMKGDTPNGQ